MDRQKSVFHDFGRQGATPQQLDILARAIGSSPKLNRELTAVIEAGDVTQLGYLPADSTAGGTYDSTHRTLNFKAAFLNGTPTQAVLDRLAAITGHEVSHAMQRADAYTASVRFVADVQRLAQTGAPRRDYTTLVDGKIQTDRRQETLAELNGLNTIADRMQHTGNEVTAESLARRASGYASCVSGRPPAFDPDIRFDATSKTIPVDAHNIEAVARCFYDIPRPTSEYRYESASHALSVIAQKEFEARKLDPDHPRMGAEIDFKALGLDREKLRQQEFDLGPHRDGPFYLIDSSDPQRRPLEIEHTSKARENKSHLTAATTMKDEAHPDNALYRQSVQAVGALDRETGKSFDADSERLAASITVLAKENGLSRIDHIVLSRGGDRLNPGEHVFVVQGELNDPANLRAHMSNLQAITTPVETSFQKAETLNETRTAEQLHRQQQQEASQPQEATRFTHMR